MEDSSPSVVIHGHFYQPPRDDPWLDTVEAQPSATPFHDWNERITAECYRSMVAARVPGSGGRIADIVNTLEFISFNFGPTLLEWMEGEAPQTYRSILEADRKSSRATGGFGNAIAQAYHHTILPLASRREKTLEVRWGLADFRRRFGRESLGMWLPETAVDHATLDVLAQEGIAFTIVAPHQVRNHPPNGLPGFVRTDSGRTIALFIYNGPLSHGVAFGSLLADAQKWARDMVPSRGKGSAHLVSIATDGETYGHHHRFGEMALAAVLGLLQQDPRARVENFSSFLSRHPPEHEVELLEPSSWSCSHGVDRWQSDCGCKMDPAEETQQEWRVELREALEWLASQIHSIFEEEGPALLGEPWAALDRYGPWADTEPRNPRALELLELERNALRLFTSCGWFFDDMARIEPLQVLRYASRALELTGPKQDELEEGFLTRLENAWSNEEPPRNGRTIFLEEVKPQIPAPLRVAAGATLWEAVTASSGLVHEPDLSVSRPMVSGFRVEGTTPNTFKITHKRTGRRWEVETGIRRPSLDKGSIGARFIGEGEEFEPLDLSDLPDVYRIPIIETLLRRVPEPGRALQAAIEELGQLAETPEQSLQEKVGRIGDLADLLVLLGEPIPFDAQTSFFRILAAAPPSAANQLTMLREPLGFTPAP